MEDWRDIRQGDSPLRYYIRSRSRSGREHLVELDSYGGIGNCTCEHFRMRLEPDIKNGKAKANPAPYRCHHIIHARDYLLRKMINALVEQRRASGVSDDPYAHQDGPEKRA